LFDGLPNDWRILSSKLDTAFIYVARRVRVGASEDIARWKEQGTLADAIAMTRKEM